MNPMSTLKSIALLLGVMMLSANLTQAGEVYEIDQLTDMSAATPEQFYRFEPNYFWIKPGDSVRFLNSVGNHTVKSVRGIWPEEIDQIDIEHEPQYEITLTEPGIYGFKCKVHNRHGMFALIIVGEVEPKFDLWEDAAINDVGKRVFASLFDKFKADYQLRN